MSGNFDEFSKAGYFDFEIEALQEIANVGVGHAATALSQLLHRRVDMSIPVIELIKMNDLAVRIAGSLEAIVSGILVDTEDGDKKLNFLLFYNAKTTRSILKILRSGEPPEDLKNLDKMSVSILKETANILLLHTISAISTFTETKWFPESPQLSIDMIGSMIQEIIGRDQDIRQEFLLVECDIFTDEEVLKGIILMLPNEIGRAHV